MVQEISPETSSNEAEQNNLGGSGGKGQWRRLWKPLGLTALGLTTAAASAALGIAVSNKPPPKAIQGESSSLVENTWGEVYGAWNCPERWPQETGNAISYDEGIHNDVLSNVNFSDVTARIFENSVLANLSAYYGYRSHAPSEPFAMLVAGSGCSAEVVVKKLALSFPPPKSRLWRRRGTS